MSEVSGLEITYQYDEAGNRKKIVRGAQNYSAFTYDERDRLSGISHVVSGSPAAGVTYTRDGVGSPTVAEWTNGSSWTDYYGYDEMNRLTNYSRNSSPPSAVWNYDWVGNRQDTGFVYDSQTDALLQPPPGTNRQYDGAGNMTVTGSVSYMYNAQNLLAALSTMRWNTWDAEQRRLGLNLGMGGTAFTFVYDPTASIPAVIQEFSSGGRNMVYVREPDGSLVARFTPGESPTVDYYYFDGLGSTVLMTEGLSTVTDRYDYTPWGEVTHLSGTTADNPYQYVGQLGYYDHWMDSSLSDLLHLGVRFYEPGVGRFSQRDQNADEVVSAYCYIGSSPLLSTDPTGYEDRKENPVWLYVDDECRQLEDRLKKILSKAVKYQPEKDDEPVRDINVGKKKNGPLDFVYWQDAEKHKLHGVKVKNGTGKVQVHCKKCRKENEKFFWVDIDAIPVAGARKVKIPEGLDWPWPVKK